MTVWWYSSHLVLASLPDNREEDAKELKGLVDKTPSKISDWNFYISETSNVDFQVKTIQGIFFLLGAGVRISTSTQFSL